MKNQTQKLEVDGNLAEFLTGKDHDIWDRLSKSTDTAIHPIPNQLKGDGIKDRESLELLKGELEALKNKFLRQFKVCHSLSELLDKIEAPTEASDLKSLKALVYSELRWLEWQDEEVFAATREDEVKWLEQLAVKAIGRTENSRSQI